MLAWFLGIVGALVYIPGVVFAAREIRRVDGDYIAISPSESAELIYANAVFSWAAYAVWRWLGKRESAE